MPHTPVIVVQGGAGSYTTVFENAEERVPIISGVQASAKTGYSVLDGGGTSVDAVQVAVRYMEDSPLFNAGRGSYLTNDYTIEMDAAIMDGTTLKTGAVACITNVCNPVLVARAVMEKTPHTMFCGEAAKIFAEKQGFSVVPTETLLTEKAVKRLESVPNFNPSVSLITFSKDLREELSKTTVSDGAGEHDTVGAVAVDCHGNVAYATSTGGISAKMCGRVGDSPIVGCGGYADNESGAISTTGHGEAFVKICTAKHAAMLIEQGKTPQEAIEDALELTARRVNGIGGGVAVNRLGDIGVYMTSEGMAWASIKNGVIKSGIFKDDVTTYAYGNT